MAGEEALAAAFRACEIKHASRLGGTVADADEARLRIRAHVQQSQQALDVQEFQCPAMSAWEMLVLHSLLKRYGLQPYRYRKQRKSTVLVRISKGLMNNCLWPL